MFQTRGGWGGSAGGDRIAGTGQEISERDRAPKSHRQDPNREIERPRNGGEKRAAKIRGLHLAGGTNCRTMRSSLKAPSPSSSAVRSQSARWPIAGRFICLRHPSNSRNATASSAT